MDFDMCQGRSTPYIGDKLRIPTFNDGNPDSMGYIKPYGIGLMSSSVHLLYGNHRSLDPSTYGCNNLNTSVS